MQALAGYLSFSGGKTWINEGTLTIGGDDFIYFGASARVQHADQRAGATLNLSSTNGTPLNFYTGRRR